VNIVNIHAHHPGMAMGAAPMGPPGVPPGAGAPPMAGPGPTMGPGMPPPGMAMAPHANRGGAFSGIGRLEQFYRTKGREG
jgi:hypothetical protein